MVFSEFFCNEVGAQPWLPEPFSKWGAQVIVKNL